MLLTVDIGNTTVCFCGLKENETGGYQVVSTRKVGTDPSMTVSDWRAVLTSILGRHTFLGAALSSVVPAITGPVAAAVESILGQPPLLVTAKTDTGLTFDVPEPELLGVDRIVDAAWVAANYPLPAVTADLGTATTINVIDKGGIFLGGAIALGVESSIHALGILAAQLPRLEVDTPKSLIGKTTEECMQVGAVAGTAALIDGLVANIEDCLGPVSLVLTGGLAHWVAPLCHHPNQHEPQMLPKGLALIYQRNLALSNES